MAPLLLCGFLFAEDWLRGFIGYVPLDVALICVIRQFSGFEIPDWVVRRGIEEGVLASRHCVIHQLQQTDALCAGFAITTHCLENRHQAVTWSTALGALRGHTGLRSHATIKSCPVDGKVRT